MMANCTNPVGSTRVTRVQFGVPPNWGEARGGIGGPVSFSPGCVLPPTVLGATPETTRQRRVLPTAIGDFQHA